MSYQVLARKYRPQRFSEVIGQDHITTTLKNAISQGRIHHAYLFTGARGIGKTTVARILAKSLNCQDRKGEEPCGKCGPCVEITSGSSLDVQEIDGASNTSVDDVREIRERVKYMPSSGKYKIYIIDEVHMLSTNAFNALLKTLEEPPPHVIFIFATTEAHKIPATILSRCQRHDFKRIPHAKISQTLREIAKGESVAIDDEAIRLISHEATGSMRDAESLMDQAIAYSGNSVTADSIRSMLGFLDRKNVFDVIRAAGDKDPKRALLVLDEVFSTGADMVRFAMEVLEVLRHMLVVAECGGSGAAIDVSPDELSEIEKGARDLGAPWLHQMFSQWYRIAEGVSRSPSPKTLLEVGVIKLCRLGSVKSIDEVISKLDAVMAGDQLGASAPVPASRPVRQSQPQPRPEPLPKPQTATVPGPTFEAAQPADVASENKWQEFMRWLVVKRPQDASLLQSGEFGGVADGSVKLEFKNPLYADMLVEPDRKAHLEGLFKEFFKRPLALSVLSKDGEVASGAAKVQDRKQRVREALGSDIVKQAAEILDAKLHEVKVGTEK